MPYPPKMSKTNANIISLEPGFGLKSTSNHELIERKQNGGFKRRSPLKDTEGPHRQLRIENLDFVEDIRDEQRQYRQRHRWRGGSQVDSVDSVNSEVLHM